MVLEVPNSQTWPFGPSSGFVSGCDGLHRASERCYPSPKVGAVSKRSYHTSKEWQLRGRRRAERSYPTLKVRKGSGEEIPLVQGKEQWLCFAGAAVKRCQDFLAFAFWMAGSTH